MQAFGSLARLPITASDFASATLTASVPRQHLRLVLVRDVGVSCRTLALLVDARHTVARLCEAIRDTVRATSSTHLYTRVAGRVAPLVPSSMTVEDECAIDAGSLRGALNTTGALRAYERHATVRSRVCIRRAAELLGRYERSPTGNELAERYATGLRRLGTRRPTTRVRDECRCTGEASCSCFMSRAVWRAGIAWLLVYALNPATSICERPMWLERMCDESEDGSPSPLEVIVPSTWRMSARELLIAIGPLDGRALEDEDDSSSSLSLIHI